MSLPKMINDDLFLEKESYTSNFPTNENQPTNRPTDQN